MTVLPKIRARRAAFVARAVACIGALVVGVGCPVVARVEAASVSVHSELGQRAVVTGWASSAVGLGLPRFARSEFTLREPHVEPGVAGFEAAGPGGIEDPTHAAMRGFYQALRRSDERVDGALTRVLHMGDSSIGLDGLPHALRTRMQARFGDGGAGFVLLDRYSPNYKNNAARIESENWRICYLAYLCDAPGHYGLGGHVFTSKRGSVTRLSTRPAEAGTEVARFEVWYAGIPRGGDIALRVDKGSIRTLPTRSEELDDRWHVIEVEPGPHTLELKPSGSGRIRAYGVVMETAGPGVVWDTVSMIGAFTKRLHGYDDAHIAAQIARRAPDLLVLNYGGNDLRRLVSRSVDPEHYKQEFVRAIRKLRAGRPAMACLVVGVIDHGRSGRRIVEPRHVETMVTAQREAAFESGCAFFDSVHAMGGAGSIARWRKQRPALAEPDLKHLNRRGREAMGQMMYDAIRAGYAAYRAASVE